MPQLPVQLTPNLLIKKIGTNFVKVEIRYMLPNSN
ncbi:hypothetical protein Coch_1706 [Capnocytophaga ochracea DSM 7271]|uniref:Uncharacterized protein n=1 Tax=Capnocytophaga ochracea (strain ATCC 27872 / DSM 7271 / CCUG 9716 / JCM 12966 / NCTC 12371 / SS31 / VPI 2845) TaxID=521097 RepID=C7M7Q7_CAPOD|nr:hypothetical protein Coch_1706 [Capnocytophaga ochracea DSM 7271]